MTNSVKQTVNCIKWSLEMLDQKVTTVGYKDFKFLTSRLRIFAVVQISASPIYLIN